MATGAVILGAIAAAGTAYSVYQGRQAAKAQKRARGVQKEQRQAEEARARRAQIAEARRKRAMVVNTSGAGGTLDSSGAIGGLGNLQSELGGNLGFMERSSDRSSLFEHHIGRANSATEKSNIGSAIAGISMQGAGMFGPPSAPTGSKAVKAPVRQAGPTSPLFDTPGPNPRG